MKAKNILNGLLNTAALPEALATLAHISGTDPILSSPFLIGSAGAAALAAVGIAAEQLQTVEHLKPVLHMSQTPPKIFLPAVPLGYNLPKWRET